MSGLMYGGGNSGGSGAGDKPQFDYSDSHAERSFVSFFRKLAAPASGTVRLFDRTNYYSAHGPDALAVAQAVYKTQSVIKYLGATERDQGLPSCTLNQAAAKSFLREALTSKQLRIEIYSTEGGKKNAGWEIAAQASPGNLQEVEDLLFSQTDMIVSPMIIAFKIKQQDGVLHVGAAFADAANREIGVAEYPENELFSNTELGIKECILPDDKAGKDVELSKLRLVIDRCDCVVTARSKSEFAGKDIEQDLERLLRRGSAAIAASNGTETAAADDAGELAVSTLPQMDMKLAMGSASAVIAYLNLLRDSDNFGQYTLRTHDLAQYLRLDNSALRAMSLFPEPGATGHAKSMSVFGLLNRCKTAQGTRMLAQWLKQPLRNLHIIQERQTLVDLFLQDITLRQTLQDEQLKMMPDLHRISKRFQRGVASLEDVVRVYQAILRLPDIVQALEMGATDVSDEAYSELLTRKFIKPLQTTQQPLEKLQQMVEETIDLNELSRHNFVIRADFDDKLRKIKDKLDEVRDGLDEQHKIAGKKLGLDIDKKLHLENHSTYGYCFRITRADAEVLKSVKGYAELSTQKNGVYFRSSALSELAIEFSDLLKEYQTAQSSVVKEIIVTAASYCVLLEQLNVILAELDVLLSFALVAGSAPIPWIKPEMKDSVDGSQEMLIEEGRHPCLEVQEDISFIPNDTIMKPGESEFLVITGPNMGGKSTYIRQTGIIALLAQVGCFVPAAEGCTLPIFDCILARVGAGDSQLKGVSTFMAEMLETATILKTATKDSLIIIDELGRGTSTYDGFGLAWAISEWIATKIRCKCLFATHFHELTALAKQQAHAKNLHVVAHVKQRKGATDRQDRDITLLYKVEEGISDQSFGIHVAELANFPESVIRLAKRKVEELEDFEDGDSQDNATALAADGAEADKGAELIEEFMSKWAARSAELEKEEAVRSQDDGDDGEPPAKKRKHAQDRQIAELRKLVQEYQPRMKSDPWVAKVLSTF